MLTNGVAGGPRGKRLSTFVNGSVFSFVRWDRPGVWCLAEPPVEGRAQLEKGFGDLGLRHKLVLWIWQASEGLEATARHAIMACSGGGWIVSCWVYCRTVLEFDRPPSSPWA